MAERHYCPWLSPLIVFWINSLAYFVFLNLFVSIFGSRLSPFQTGFTWSLLFDKGFKPVSGSLATLILCSSATSKHLRILGSSQVLRGPYKNGWFSKQTLSHAVPVWVEVIYIVVFSRLSWLCKARCHPLQGTLQIAVHIRHFFTSYLSRPREEVASMEVAIPVVGWTPGTIFQQ